MPESKAKDPDGRRVRPFEVISVEGGRLGFLTLTEARRAGVDVVSLDWIQATPKGCGQGSTIRDLLCEAADRYNVMITLTLKADDPANVDRLVAFYEKSGFVGSNHYTRKEGFAGKPSMMDRSPRSALRGQLQERPIH